MAFDPTTHLFDELRALSDRVKRLEDRGIVRAAQHRALVQQAEGLAKRVDSLEALRARCLSYLQRLMIASPAALLVGANANMGQIAEVFLRLTTAAAEALK
jgi:hypothetical protein